MLETILRGILGRNANAAFAEPSVDRVVVNDRTEQPNIATRGLRTFVFEQTNRPRYAAAKAENSRQAER